MKKVAATAGLLLALALLSGCSNEKESASVVGGGMKCGAGKCGSSMVDGSTLLGKKKQNILAQMRKDDPRKECVMGAKSTKALYDCVRDPKTKRITTKCGAGKCGTSMQAKSQKKPQSMQCGAGKCGASMEAKKVEKKSMKCGAGKCGSGM